MNVRVARGLWPYHNFLEKNIRNIEIIKTKNRRFREYPSLLFWQIKHLSNICVCNTSIHTHKYIQIHFSIRVYLHVWVRVYPRHVFLYHALMKKYVLAVQHVRFLFVSIRIEAAGHCFKSKAKKYRKKMHQCRGVYIYLYKYLVM